MQTIHAVVSSNHYTFYVNQLAAAKLYLGDTEGAQNALKNYFGHQFKDQVAQSGEQPFEAVRTRPYHYRSFNLEAMIVSRHPFRCLLSGWIADTCLNSRQTPNWATNSA